MNEFIKSWGNTSNKYVEIKNAIDTDDTLLSYGNLNSYGDAGIPFGKYKYEAGGHEVLDGFISPSKTIEDFIKENKRMLFGVPGKNNVTLGGAVASDVHGKDGSWGGSFCRNIESLQIQLPCKDIVICNTKENSEIFYSTVGGYGLTGSILGVKFKKNSVPYSSFYLCETRKGHGIKTLIKQFTKEENKYEVAWINLLNKKNSWVFEASSHAENKYTSDIVLNTNKDKELNFSLGFIGNNAYKSMSMINSTYFKYKKESIKIKSYSDVFYPLGFLSNTKNIASNRKIIQVQFSLPKENEEYLNDLIQLLIFNQNPILCSLKKLSENTNYQNLSFTQDGWTVAVDFSAKYFDHNSIRVFYKKLIEMGGKIYLAKDSTLNASEFRAMYSSFYQWREIVKKIDPKNLFQSELSYRLGLKKW